MAWVAPGQVLALKTECVRGHKYTPENTYRKDDGYRRCIECRRQDGRANYYRTKAAA